MTVAVSIIVPCHDEAATIRRKLENCLALRASEPVEILVIDDYSSDATRETVEDVLRARAPLPATRSIRLLANRFAPGKNGALQTAFAEARGAIHLITDADVTLAADVLERARARFAEERDLGALCLSPRVTSARAATAAEFAGAYERFNRWLKIRQSRLDSLPILHGQAMFLRAGEGVTPHDRQPADDVDFAFQYRRRGLRVRYAPDIRFDEELAPERRRVFRQKVRRAVSVMRTFWHYRGVLFNPRYGAFGLVCFPIDFFLYFVLSPAACLVVAGGMIWLAVAFGAAGVGVGLAGALASLATPARSVATYLAVLLIAQLSLVIGHRPRLRWNTPRPAAHGSTPVSRR